MRPGRGKFPAGGSGLGFHLASAAPRTAGTMIGKRQVDCAYTIPSSSTAPTTIR